MVRIGVDKTEALVHPARGNVVGIDLQVGMPGTLVAGGEAQQFSAKRARNAPAADGFGGEHIVETNQIVLHDELTASHRCAVQDRFQSL